MLKPEFAQHFANLIYKFEVKNYKIKDNVIEVRDFTQKYS